VSVPIVPFVPTFACNIHGTGWELSDAIIWPRFYASCNEHEIFVRFGNTVTWRPKEEIVKSEYTFIARQRLSKHSRGNEYASNDRVTSVVMQRCCKHAFPTIKRPCFLHDLCKVVTKKGSVESTWVSRRHSAGIWASEQRNWIESSLRNWQLQMNGKKGIRLWKEDFMGDFKLQWDCDKSVARIRLVKAENPSACVTVNSKVCRSAIALCVYGVNKFNHPIQNPSYKSRTTPRRVTILWHVNPLLGNDREISKNTTADTE
jgi:hypothetical protein